MGNDLTIFIIDYFTILNLRGLVMSHLMSSVLSWEPSLAVGMSLRAMLGTAPENLAPPVALETNRLVLLGAPAHVLTVFT